MIEITHVSSVSKTTEKVDKEKKTKDEIGLEAPWHTFHKQFLAIFGQDKELTISEDLKYNDDGSVTFSVKSSNQKKILAIRDLVGTIIPYGNVKLYISYQVLDLQDNTTAKDWVNAFDGNPLFVGIGGTTMPGYDSKYALFKKEILTFYDDDITDYKGNKNQIVADMVKDIIRNDGGIIPCTE